MSSRLASLLLLALMLPAWLLPGPLAVCLESCACISEVLCAEDVASSAHEDLDCPCCESEDSSGGPDAPTEDEDCPCCVLLAGGLEDTVQPGVFEWDPPAATEWPELADWPTIVRVTTVCVVTEVAPRGPPPERVVPLLI